jgi:glycosyltransferase involved in cell wall biosynthesis
MKIVFLWTGVTAPMATCWRALAKEPGVTLTVFSELHRGAHTAYQETDLLQGVDHELRYDDEPLDVGNFAARVAALEPDVMIVLGWRSRMCRGAVESRRLRGVPKILSFDLQFAWTLRKLLAPVVLRRYVRRFAGAFVPGERSAAYARWLGFSDDRIDRGIAGLDTSLYEQAAAERAAADYPRKFLFVGRYSLDKGIDVLVEAYRAYRSSAAHPWPLTCCGMGPEQRRLNGEAGITDLGFVQPQALPAVYSAHGAFVLPSRLEPWGFVLQEAVAAGLPVVCTADCGAHVELVHSYFNGRVIAANDPAGLTAALTWMDEHHGALPAMGRSGMPFVAPYSTRAWVTRVLEVCQGVL